MVFPDISLLCIKPGDLWRGNVFFAVVFLLFHCLKLGRAGVLRKVIGKTMLGVSFLPGLLLACPKFCLE